MEDTFLINKADVWLKIQNFITKSREQFLINRKVQNEKWLQTYLQNKIYYEIKYMSENNPMISKLHTDVKDNKISIPSAVEPILHEYKKTN
jgi:hypothetical protein